MPVRACSQRKLIESTAAVVHPHGSAGSVIPYFWEAVSGVQAYIGPQGLDTYLIPSKYGILYWSVHAIMAFELGMLMSSRKIFDQDSCSHARIQGLTSHMHSPSDHHCRRLTPGRAHTRRIVSISPCKSKVFTTSTLKNASRFKLKNR